MENQNHLFKKGWLKKGVRGVVSLATAAPRAIGTGVSKVVAPKSKLAQSKYKIIDLKTPVGKQFGRSLVGLGTAGAVAFGAPALLGGGAVAGGGRILGKLGAGSGWTGKVGEVFDKNKDFSKDIVKGVLNKAVDGQGGVGQWQAKQDEGIGFSDLTVFRPAMTGALLVKGISPSGNTETLSRQFYDNVVRSTTPAQNSADAYQTPKEIIIDAIVKYFISAKNKKDSGAEMTKIDEIAARGYENAKKSVDETVDESVRQGVGDWIVDNKGLVIGVGVGIFILIIVLIARPSK